MAKIITGDRPKIEGKSIKLELNVEEPHQEEKCEVFANANNIPAQATFESYRPNQPPFLDIVEYKWTWWEVTV